MLTFKRHRFAALAAAVLVALILALTTGSSMTTEAARTIDNTKEGQTGPGYVINARLNVAAADAQNLRDGNMLAGGLLQQSVQRQMEKEEMLRLRTEENKKLLEEQAKRDARAAINCSDEDYNTLLRIVQAEAGVCDEKGKILVANVIINRVRSPRFPNTIRGVVYQANQFSPVSNGSINRVRVTQETIDCVDRALAGEDYSQGALFFMNRGRSRSGAVGWFDRSLTYLFSHDGHEFFK